MSECGRMLCLIVSLPSTQLPDYQYEQTEYCSLPAGHPWPHNWPSLHEDGRAA